jgi:hypothetical protein
MFKPGMLNKYNFINIISVAMAGVTGGLYLYTIYPYYFNHPVTSAILYVILFFMICVFAGRVKRSVWNMIENKWFYIIESLIFLGLPVYFIMHGYNNYWNIAGVLLLGYLIIYTSSNVRENIIRLEVFLISPVFYYGMIFQNSFFTEAIFAVSFLLLIDRMIDKNRIDHYFIMSAVILAFLVFINPFLGVLFIVFSTYRLRQDITRGVLFFLIACVAYYFMISLLKGQVTVLSLPFTNISIAILLPLILLLISAVYAGWISRNIYEVLFSSSLLMFITVLIYSSSLQVPRATLLSVIYPLFIFAIRDSNTKEYIGKILED